MSWQPIETAPKDGTSILIDGPCGVVIAWWDGDDWADLMVTLNGSTPAKPSLWNAIPELPQ